MIHTVKPLGTRKNTNSMVPMQLTAVISSTTMKSQSLHFFAAAALTYDTLVCPTSSSNKDPRSRAR